MMPKSVTWSSAEDSESSATPGGPKRRRRRPRIVTSDDDLVSGTVKITDSSELQRAICVELAKITSSLNAVTKSLAAETTSSYVKRSGGLWAAPQHATVRDSNDNGVTLAAAGYDALKQQFTTLIIISTFTGGLIIAFLTLAYNILSNRTEFPTVTFEIGMFFALGGMAIHLGIIVAAGRSTTLALKYAEQVQVQAYLRKKERRRKKKEAEGYESDISAMTYSPNDEPGSPSRLGKGKEPEFTYSYTNRPGQPSTNITNHSIVQTPLDELPAPFARFPRPRQPSQPQYNRRLSLLSLAVSEFSDLSQDQLQTYDFRPFLKVCESFQVLGTAIFFVSIMILIFDMFFHREFPIILLVGCVVGLYMMIWKTGFWKASAVHHLISIVGNRWGTWKEKWRASPAAGAKGTNLGDIVGDSGGGNAGANFSASLKLSISKGKKLSTRLFGFGVPWQETVDVEKDENEKTSP
ncbi:hypothetical protein AX15_006574 [Amanita polypyramis BW_CC]|nr:hypothetical protein AX15_006574 [Amanita polypyramis BW_CC]